MTGAAVLGALANMGAGALLGAAGLVVFARMTAPRFIHEPAATHRALVTALTLASVLLLAPWVRLVVAHTPPEPEPGAASGGAPASIGPSAVGFYVLCVVGGAWLMATSLAAAVNAISVAQLAGVIKRARPAPPPLERAVARCRCPGVRRLRRVVVSDEASVPFAAVPWAPVLVMPSTLLARFDSEALDLMVEHEAVHLARRDLWTSAAVRMLSMLFPFSPVAVRLASDIGFAREATVDAIVVATCDRHRYATLLLDVAASARFDQLPRPVSMDQTALGRRIDMLTDDAARRPVPLAPLLVIAAAIATSAVIAPPILAAPPLLLPPALPGPGAIRLQVPEGSYAVCDSRSAGEACFVGSSGPGTCQPGRNGRLFCMSVMPAGPLPPPLRLRGPDDRP